MHQEIQAAYPERYRTELSGLNEQQKQLQIQQNAVCIGSYLHQFTYFFPENAPLTEVLTQFLQISNKNFWKKD